MIAQELEVSLHMAFVDARQKRHEFITVEHLLLAMLDNPSAAEVLRLVFWMLTKYAGMSGLAFWTNIMFVLLTCARGWAGLTLYKTQEETL